MEALWGLALLPPALLLAALCTRCYRRHSAPMDEECKSPQPPQQRRVSAARPQPERAPTPPAPDDDYSNELYATGYVVVLPDPQGEARGGGSPQDRDSGSTALQDKEYENVPEGPRRSLADSLEYINVPAAGSSPASRYGSDRESEGDGPDYENVARTSPHP